MKSIRKIVKKNNKHNLGQYNRELVFRLAKANKRFPYQGLNTKRRSQAGSCLDKVGFLKILKTKRKNIIDGVLIEKKKFYFNYGIKKKFVNKKYGTLRA